MPTDKKPVRRDTVRRFDPTISARLDADDHARLTELAAQLGRTRGSLVREGVSLVLRLRAEVAA